MSIDRSTRKAFGISLSLHVLFISYFIASSLCHPSPQPLPRRLVVQSISLHSSSHRRPPVMATTPKISAPPTHAPQAPAAKEEQEIESSPPIAEKHEESAPREVSTPLHEEETESVQESSPPTPQPSAKKVSSSAKSQPAKKSSMKVASPPKGKPVSSQKTKSQTSHSTPAKKDSKKSTTSHTSSYDQNLLSEALRRLDKSKTATGKRGGNSTAGGGDSSSTSRSIAHVGSVGSLHAEGNLIGATDDSQEDGVEGYSSASPEACYIGDLIRRLQLNVRLPEPGEVRVKLSIKRNGTVAQVTVLNGKTTSVKKFIEEKLKAIHFSSFGTSFSGEAEHTFCLRLSNELIWSCS